MSLARCLAAVASVAFVLFSARFAQYESIAVDRRSDGQAALPGEGLPLSPAPAAPAVAVAEHVVLAHGKLAWGTRCSRTVT